MRKLMIVFILVFLLSGSNLYIFAKGTNGDAKSRLKKLSISLTLATTSSGPAEDIEKAMVASGFSDSSGGGFWGPPMACPCSRNGSLSWTINAHYLLGSHFSVGVIAGGSDIGHTSGYCGDCSLFIDYGVNTYAPVISCQVHGYRIGIGPALYVVKSEQSNGISQKANKIGFLLDLGITFSEKSKFFVELRGQYRLVGEAEIGPYKEKALWSDVYATFPATKVNYNHLFVGVGLGLRF